MARVFACVAAAVAATLCCATAPAPTGGSDTEIPLQFVPGSEAIVTQAIFAPGQAIKPHSHPGIEVAYQVEGTTRFQLEDQRWKVLNPGESITIPTGVVHRAEAGSDGAKLIIFRIHPLGQQLRVVPGRPVRFPE